MSCWDEAVPVARRWMLLATYRETSTYGPEIPDQRPWFAGKIISITEYRVPRPPFSSPPSTLHPYPPRVHRPPHPLFHFGMTGAFTIKGEKRHKFVKFKVSEDWPPRFTKLELQVIEPEGVCGPPDNLSCSRSLFPTIHMQYTQGAFYGKEKRRCCLREATKHQSVAPDTVVVTW